MFWVISVYFNIRNTLPKSGTFLLGHLVWRNESLKTLWISYAYWTVHHLDIWIKIDQLDDTWFIMCCLEACWCYVAGLAVGDVVSECRLKMDVLTSETCWAVKWHNKASVIKLVYLYWNTLWICLGENYCRLNSLKKATVDVENASECKLVSDLVNTV